MDKNAPFFLVIIESTDITDNAQIVVFVLYYDGDKKEFTQDLLKKKTSRYL